MISYINTIVNNKSKSLFLLIILAVSFFFAPQVINAFDQSVNIRSVMDKTEEHPLYVLPELTGYNTDAPVIFLQNDNKYTDNIVYISVSDADIAILGNEFNFSTRKPVAHGNMVSIFKVKESELDELSNIMHRRLHKSPGFFAHTTLESALEDITGPPVVMAKTFSIDQGEIVRPMLKMINENNISYIIATLSSYKNRYYRSQTGVTSARWIADYWKQLAKDRTDISVELYHHKAWPQESVILTVEGKENPKQVVILGGHLDSIAGLIGSDPVAPGADDNASGIAVLTESIRVMVKAGYKPKITLKFMAYAAEEVGLRGSREISNAFKKQGVDVQGVLQLDMTNYNGSVNDIYLISDNTNADQNAFLADLIKTYTNYSLGKTSCGYACSDHASWTRNGFIASFPFEAKIGEDNPNIHTAKDTLAQMGGNSKHAFKFTELAIAYMVEMAK